MGYEYRLHIGQERSYDSTHGGAYSHTIGVVAVVDLSNPGGKSRIFKLLRDRQEAEQVRLDAISLSPRSRVRRKASTALHTDVTIREREYHTREDSYGLPLVSIPLEEIREALAADWEDSKADYAGSWELGYRRFYVALQLIDAITLTFAAGACTNEDLLKINPLAGQLVAIPYGY